MDAGGGDVRAHRVDRQQRAVEIEDDGGDGARSGSSRDRALEKSQQARQRKVFLDQRFGQDRAQPEEFRAEDVGEELVADHDGRAPRRPEQL